MGKHDGHKFAYLVDQCVVKRQARITEDGNVVVALHGEPEIVEFDGDPWLWCDTCDEEVYAGEHGLSEKWEVV